MELFYVIVALLSPAAMLVVGICWKLHPPKFRAKGLAYRTALSCASEEAWAFAHLHCAKLWTRIGIILLVVTILLLKFVPEQRGNYILWVIGGQMALFCVSAFFVDLLLKNSFDGDGKPI